MISVLCEWSRKRRWTLSAFCLLCACLLTARNVFDITGKAPTAPATAQTECVDDDDDAVTVIIEAFPSPENHYNARRECCARGVVLFDLFARLLGALVVSFQQTATQRLADDDATRHATRSDWFHIGEFFLPAHSAMRTRWRRHHRKFGRDDGRSTIDGDDGGDETTTTERGGVTAAEAPWRPVEAFIVLHAPAWPSQLTPMTRRERVTPSVSRGNVAAVNSAAAAACF